jgi:BirA family biotin operon repressor/biotin-[acetyl-CoA-carboxylase] ligase
VTGSTNDDARAAASAGAVRGHVVVADAQRGGRGSHGRTWSSPPGVDLYLSIVERLSIEPAAIPCVTLAVGLGIIDAIVSLLPALASRVSVKWPNDAWIDQKKTAGVLVESSSTGHAQGPIVIGIGLGVNRTEWEADLGSTATSLRASAAVETELDRNVVLAQLLLAVERAVDGLVCEGPSSIAQRLDARLALRGDAVEIDGIRGSVLGVAETGALRLATPNGERLVVAGTLRRA